VAVEVKTKPKLARTPSKKIKITGMMGVSPVKGEGLPDIVVQAPTPRKPIIIATSRFTSGDDNDSEKPILEEGEEDSEEKSAGDSAALVDEVVNTASEEESKEEDIVPSPSTEYDQPTFPIPVASSHGAMIRVIITPPPASQSAKEDDVNEGDYSASIRALCPTSTFDSFTLWTADAPLAGFRADENGVEAEVEVEQGKEGQGVKVEKGWWRTGGAGEGGDEVVRAMGEWLGLVEMVSKHHSGILAVLMSR